VQKLRFIRRENEGLIPQLTMAASVIADLGHDIPKRCRLVECPLGLRDERPLQRGANVWTGPKALMPRPESIYLTPCRR